jgi:hypothetical protein
LAVLGDLAVSTDLAVAGVFAALGVCATVAVLGCPVESAEAVPLANGKTATMVAISVDAVRTPLMWSARQQAPSSRQADYASRVRNRSEETATGPTRNGARTEGSTTTATRSLLLFMTAP